MKLSSFPESVHCAARKQWPRPGQPFFEGTDAPFSWQPEQVEVLDSGALALSTGPVFSPEGDLIGVFNSIWRREPDGTWLIVFDKGGDVCPD